MALVPQHIKNLSPYKSGKPYSELARERKNQRIIKLDSNESPFGPSPTAIDAVNKMLSSSHRYPDQAGYDLRLKIARRFDLKIDNVILGAGSEGIMSTIIRTFLSLDDELIGAEHSFVGFRVLALASGRRISWVPMKNNRYDLPAMTQAINEYTKIIYLANPDNPTGTYFTKQEFAAFMEKVPGNILIILDEAYFEYADGIQDYPDSMLYRYDNVITLRTFSKVYGLAGLRIGYGFAHNDLINNLLKVKLPFEPSATAQTAALAALDDDEFVRNSIRMNAEQKALLATALESAGLQFIPSVTNFITAVFPGETEAGGFTEAMLDKGVSLRHLTAFGRPAWVRMTVGNPAETSFVIEQLKSL